jgi:hypothetical protein
MKSGISKRFALLTTAPWNKPRQAGAISRPCEGEPQEGLRMDFRPYAGERVIVGETGEQRRLYCLGTLLDGGDVPAHVKAIIEDDAYEASELLYVVPVSDDGRPEGKYPLVVVNDLGRLRYGLEFLTAVRETGITAPAWVVRGVRFE